MVSRNHPRTRRRTWYCRHLLPLDLVTTAQDVYEVLGLLTALGRGAPDDYQQVQHLPPACTNGCHYYGTIHSSHRRNTFDYHAVSLFRHRLLSNILRRLSRLKYGGNAEKLVTCLH